MNGAGERFGEGLLTIYLIAASLCSVGQKGSERQQKPSDHETHPDFRGIKIQGKKSNLDSTE